jgi:outer membrane receptor protein involved in Fe transport
MKTQTIIGDNFEYANFTEVNALPYSYTNNYRVEGFLSRLNYDFNEKYFFSASYRRDGSSRFYEDVRWGDFWSVGAGWTVDKEKFMTGVEFVDMLKLRASYGVVGNDDLSSYYPWRATYAINNNGEPGYIQSSLGNRSLTWETSNNFDVATEFRLFDNRLEGSIEYFHRVSSDLLFSVPQPISSGISSIDINAGSMYNKGFEISLNGVAVSKNDFQLSINGNATFLKNKITDLPLDPYPTSVYKIEEGHSRYDFWLRQWYGVNPATGYNLFKADVDMFTFADGELLEIDGVNYTENIAKSLYDYAGTSLPIVTGGIGANIAWKNFTLKFNFYYQLGGKFYDNNYQSLMSGSNLYFAQHEDLLGRWRKPGDVTNIAKVVAGTAVNNIGAASSTRWLLSSDMIELTNLNLSYKIPSKFLQTKNITDATIYFSADNALMISARRGVYPRRNFQSGYISNGDVYAPSRVISLGLSLTF